MSRLHLLVEDFVRRHGIAALQPDDAGRYHIVVDDAAHVQCFERFEQLYLVSPLGAVPEPGEPGRAWLKRLLNHALKRMKHSRATPALDEDGNAILFARFGMRNLSVDDLETGIADHVNALESYRRVLDADGPMRPTAAFAQSIVRP